MLGHGTVAAAVCNSAPFGDPKRKALSPLDFVPDYKAAEAKPRHKQTAEQQMVLLKGLAEAAKRKR